MLILIKNRVYFSLIKDLKVYVTVQIDSFLKEVYLYNKLLAFSC